MTAKVTSGAGAAGAGAPKPGSFGDDERRNADAKREVLQRIRNAQELAHTPKHVDVVRNYNTTSDMGRDDLRELLIDRLVDYKATVVETTEADLAADIAKAIADNGWKDNEAVYAPGMDEKLFAELSKARPDDPASDPRELGDVVAITDSHVTCAVTGTIVLQADEVCGRRALSLVPDHHICVVRPDSVVYGVPEMIGRLDPYKPNTMISGGSATSDIELVRVEGVHGPRDLVVMVVR